jgi:rare lipoprotein A
MNPSIIVFVLAVVLLTTGIEARAGASVGQTQSGIASYYHDRFQGRKTASGARYNKNALSAAHKTLPLGTKVEVTDTRTGKRVVVRINDRGPFVKGRVIDLSRAAARKIGLIKKGLTRVKVKVLSLPKRRGT